MRSESSDESDSPLDIMYDTYIGSDWFDARGFLLVEERDVPTFLRGRSTVCLL